MCVSTLSFSDPDRGRIDREAGRRAATRLIAKLPTIVARYHRRRQGLEPVEPDGALSFAENFLWMLHGERPDERAARAFDVAMILHAEHEMNASTFTARVVAGTGADLTAAVVAAIRPGLYEYQLEAKIMDAYLDGGAQRPGFYSIVGSGPNSTVLHYEANRRKIEDGDLVDKAALQAAGAQAVVGGGTGWQVIVGTIADNLAQDIQDEL